MERPDVAEQRTTTDRPGGGPPTTTSHEPTSVGNMMLRQIRGTDGDLGLHGQTGYAGTAERYVDPLIQRQANPNTSAAHEHREFPARYSANRQLIGRFDSFDQFCRQGRIGAWVNPANPYMSVQHHHFNAPQSSSGTGGVTRSS